MDEDSKIDAAARLGTLLDYRVLDTPAEPGFDEIVTLATQLCGTPVALVSLVDGHRQWFKARVGFEPCETDLDSSVCRHALGSVDILEIEDLTVDTRTRSNPLVTGAPFLRFYAGAPLNTEGGHTLGTLCVIDHVPHPGGLTSVQRSGLKALASQVMAQLDLRRAVAERDAVLVEQEAARRVVLAEAARLEAMIATQQAVASASADLPTVFQAIVDGTLRAIDAADGAVVELRQGDELVYDAASGTSAGHRGYRIPLDRTLSGRAVRQERPLLCSDTEADAEVDQQLTRFLGIRSMIVVPVTRRGEPIGALKVQSALPDAFLPRDVVMTQMLASLVASGIGDVAEARSARALHAAEVRYRQTFESVTEFGVIVTNRSGTITEWNTGAERIFGWTASEMRGTDVSRFFTPEDRDIDRVRTEMSQSLRDGQAVDERWHLRKDGSRLFASGNMMPLRGDDGEHLGYIKIVRDRTEQHLLGRDLERSRIELAASEAKWRGLFEDLKEGFILGKVVRGMDGSIVDWRYEEVNRAWGDLVGLDIAAIAGRTIREVFPGIEDEWVREFAEVVETGRPASFTRRVGTLDRFYDGIAQSIGDDRFTVMFADVTDRVLRQRRQEALLRFGDMVRDARNPADIAWAGCQSLAEALECSLVGYGGVDLVAETITVDRDWTAPNVASLAGTLHFRDFGSYIDDLKRGATVVVRDCETDERTRDCAEALKARHARAFVNMPVFERGLVALLYVSTGRPRNWTEDEVDFIREIADRVRISTERMMGERALRDSEERQRLAIGVGDVGIWELDLGTGRLLLDAAMLAMNGVTQGSLDAEGAFAAVHPADRSRLDTALQGLASGVADKISIQYRVIGIEDGVTRTVQVHGAATADQEGKVTRLVGAARDITDRVEAEERRRVLNEELSHRLKNILAMTQSIVTQTLRSAPDMVAARKILSDRIMALSQAHELLMTGQRDAATVVEVVRTASALHDPGGRVRMAGPDVSIGPKAGLTLSLIVHELGTNAVKYGALSVGEGHVDVSWVVSPDKAGGPKFTFDWREVDGPPVTPPTRKSFGSRLIEMGLSGAAGGATEVVYAPIGLRCRLTAPLAELQSGLDAVPPASP